MCSYRERDNPPHGRAYGYKFDSEFISPDYLPYNFNDNKLQADVTSCLNVELSPHARTCGGASTKQALARSTLGQHPDEPIS